MKVSCDIIRDLLPLYAEDMVSQASREMVDEHLCGCDECVKELGRLKKAQAVPLETKAPGLEKVKRGIQQRRFFTAATAVMLVITVFLGMAFLWDAPVWLSAEQAVKEIIKTEDGSVRIYYTEMVNGIASDDDGAGNRTTLCWGYWGKVYFGQWKRVDASIVPDDMGGTTSYTHYGYPGPEYENPYLPEFDDNASLYNYWYLSPKDGTAEVLMLKGEGDYEAPQLPFLDINHHLVVYCCILAGAAMVFTALAYWLEKYRGAVFLKYGAVLAGCACVSALWVSGGQFAEIYGIFTGQFIKSLILTVPMFITVLCALRLRTLKRQDKGL